MSQFKIGDVVQLKSGGPNMTVESDAREGCFVCTWFERSELKRTTFQGALLRVPEAPAPLTRAFPTRRGY
jgi:uncharacterized protein YodC (DUF2158 family)